MAQYVAGKEVDFFCTRCKLELAHTIIALVDSKPARVLCNTCHSERKWRDPSGTKKRTTVKKRTTSKTQATKVSREQQSQIEREQLWTALMNQASTAGVAVKAYDMKATFDKGAVVAHTRFGDGVVSERVDATKILVCFRDGARVLIHGREA
jgi:hypothetical protein